MIEFDFNDVVSHRDGKKELSASLEALNKDISSIMERIRGGGDFLGWVNLPAQEETAAEIAGYVSSLPSHIEHAVIMGIGGSSLGPRALYSAAYHPMYWFDGWRPKGRRLYFLDNSDPETIASVMDCLDVRKTLFVVITKSGSTAETVSQMMIAWERAHSQLGEKAPGHFIFITDPEKGDLRAISKAHGVKAFSVPPDVGGRFSVLSSVGLVPAALAGIDPVEILRPARAVMERCLSPVLFENPAALIGACAFLLDKHFGKNIHVLMCYSDGLSCTGAWFRQLWGESLGKSARGEPVGPTPLDARGATDQHSLLQLLKEGPKDKFVMFVDVRRRRRLEIPSSFETYGAFSYLGGHSVGDLISYERQGTHRSLVLAQVPTLSILLEDASVSSAAALMYVLEVATAVAGFLYGIDPFNQPGVEESKKFAQALMGRPGYDTYRDEIKKSAGARDPRWIMEI